MSSSYSVNNYTTHYDFPKCGDDSFQSEEIMLENGSTLHILFLL